MGYRGAVRCKAAVELAVIKEQQTLARAAILDLDLPRDGGRPRSAHLQNAIAWCLCYASCQGVCTRFVQPAPRVPMLLPQIHLLAIAGALAYAL